MPTPCIFFDRDGIVNRRPDPARYVTSRDKFILIPEFVDTLRLVTERGYPAVVVTNQRGIALGCMSEEEVDAIHQELAGTLEQEGLAFLDILVCPHDDNDHPWRKPNPGMLLEAAKRHRLDLPRSWMIGDHLTDVQAGKSAGCRTILVDQDDPDSEADYLAEGMAGALRVLQAHLEPRPADHRRTSAE